MGTTSSTIQFRELWPAKPGRIFAPALRRHCSTGRTGGKTSKHQRRGQYQGVMAEVARPAPAGKLPGYPKILYQVLQPGASRGNPMALLSRVTQNQRSIGKVAFQESQQRDQGRVGLSGGVDAAGKSGAQTEPGCRHLDAGNGHHRRRWRCPLVARGVGDDDARSETFFLQAEPGHGWRLWRRRWRPARYPHPRTASGRRKRRASASAPPCRIRHER